MTISPASPEIGQVWLHFESVLLLVDVVQDLGSDGDGPEDLWTCVDLTLGVERWHRAASFTGSTVRL